MTRYADNGKEIITIVDSNFKRQANIKSTISSKFTEQLNGEETLEFEVLLDTKLKTYLHDDSIFEYDGQYYDLVSILRTNNQNGSKVAKVGSEHVSYRLNDQLYNLEYFAKIGTIEELLTEILLDTPFTVGTVELGTPTGGNVFGAIMTEMIDENGDPIIGSWNVALEDTSGTYYKTATYDPITGIVTYGTPSGIIAADVALAGLYLYKPDLFDPQHKYIKLKTILGTIVSWETWALYFPYSIQEPKSRRATVMDFAAYIYGEVLFDNFEVSIVAHRGDLTSIPTIKNRNVSVIATELNKRQLDKDGNPSITYTCTNAYDKSNHVYRIGDNITLIDNELNIREELRVVSISKDPYDVTDIAIQFSKYDNNLADSMYRIETSSVTKDLMYNGTRIGPEFGFENVRRDKRARSYFRADDLRFQSGPASNTLPENKNNLVWVDRLYFEYDNPLDPNDSEMRLRFNGILDSEVIVTPNLYADNGNIANLTVGRLDTSKKVYNYLKNITDPVRYIEIKGQVIQFMEAIIPTTGYGSRAVESGVYDMTLDPFEAESYSSIDIVQDTGDITFINGGWGSAWDSFHSGRIYRVVSGHTDQFIKLIGSDDVTYKVYWERHETFTFGYTGGLIGSGHLDLTYDTYYSDVSVDPLTGEVTFIDPYYTELSADEALYLGYNWFRQGTSTTIYRHLVNIDGNKINYNIYESGVLEGSGYLNFTNGTFYQGKSINGATGEITFNTPTSPNTPADEALVIGYNWFPHDTDPTIYRQLLDRIGNEVTYYEYQVSQDWDRRVLYTNKEGQLCYWLNAEKTIMTTKVTADPVYIFRYNDFVKMEHSFSNDWEEGGPSISMGHGDLNGNGKGSIHKDADGLYIDYYARTSGNYYMLKLGDDGISFDNAGITVPCPPPIVILTVAEYAALATKDENTLYFTY